MKKCLAAVLEGPKKIVLREFPVPEVEKDDILLKVEITGVDGTDANSYKGQLSKELYKEQYPRIMGDEVVGFIEEIGDDAAKSLKLCVGDRVVVEPKIACGNCEYCCEGYYQFCKESRTYGVILSNKPPFLWGGQAEYMYIVKGSRVHKISKEVSPERAVLASVVLPDGIRWIQKSKIRVGDTVVILGAGPQGLASVVAAKLSGAGKIVVTGLARDGKRLEIAQELGANSIITIEEGDCAEQVRAVLKDVTIDAVIECTGVEQSIQGAIDMVKPTGVCVIVGMPTSPNISLSTIRIAKDEISLLGGRAPLSWAVQSAIKVVETTNLPIQNIISHIYSLSNANEALKAMANESSITKDAVKVAIKP